MQCRITIGRLMLAIAAIGLEFGLLPTFGATILAGPTLLAVLGPTRLLWVLAGVGLTAGFLLPTISTCRYRAHPGAICSARLRQVGLALLLYQRDNGCLPPAHVCDSSGRPMHSWRVLILPYLGGDDLYNAYNFDQPWDGPDNRKLLAEIPDVFACPVHLGASGLTPYVVPVGPTTLFPSSRATLSTDMGNDSSRLMLVIERAGAPVPWTKPTDWDLDDPTSPAPSAPQHPDGSRVVYADGAVDRLGRTVSAAALRGLATRYNSVLDQPSVTRPSQSSPHLRFEGAARHVQAHGNHLRPKPIPDRNKAGCRDVPEQDAQRTCGILRWR